jgi:hypothetical protein
MAEANERSKLPSRVYWKAGTRALVEGEKQNKKLIGPRGPPEFEKGVVFFLSF